jgi:hypothetical protein
MEISGSLLKSFIQDRPIIVPKIDLGDVSSSSLLQLAFIGGFEEDLTKHLTPKRLSQTKTGIAVREQ